MALRPISRTENYVFPESAWDVRGWQVRTEEGDAKVGKVADMLLDAGGGLRYLDVDLGFMKKHVLVPLDHAYADQAAETVWLEDIGRRELERVPEYALDPESLDEAYERRLDTLYGGTRAGAHRELVAPAEDEDADLGLRRMDELDDDYRVAGKDPRGWTVVTGEGRKVAKVTGLLVDPGTMKAEFLDVLVDEKSLGLEPVDRHLLIPADRVRLDRRKKRVLVAGLLAHDLAQYPPYTGLPFRRGFAREVREYFDRAGASRSEREARPRSGPRPPESDWRETSLRHFYRPQRARERTREE